MSKMKSFIFVILCLFFATCLIENEEVTITLEKLSIEYTGKKGTLAVETYTSYTFKEDTTKKIYFDSTISNEKNEYTTKCGFWKALEDKNLYVFCNIGTDIPSGNYTIDFSGIPKFNYQNQTIIFSDSKFLFEKLEQDFIDLYSDKQEINIVDDKDIYELKFNVFSYNNEILMIDDSFFDCNQEKSQLICKTKKTDLEKMFRKSEKQISVYFTCDKISYKRLPLVGPIVVKDYITQKTDVYIKITKLIENITDSMMYIAYETNVTNINKVMTRVDDLELDFENDKEGIYKTGCILKKNDGFPLFLLCFIPFTGSNWLKEIKTEIVLNESNVRYNFRIQPGKNEEKIYTEGNGRGISILWSYPEILNFTKKDNLYIDFSASETKSLKGMTFNQDKEDLSCEIRQNGLLRCIVPKSHFEGKQNGYYLVKHKNHMGGKTTFFESDSIKVILSEPDPKPSKGSIHLFSFYYSLLLILVLF